MRVGGHSWHAVTEMSAAVYLPYLLLLPPLWAGLITGGTPLTAGHVLMLPAMAPAMVRRHRRVPELNPTVSFVPLRSAPWHDRPRP